MTSSTQFYRKPVKVRAVQWNGQHDFVDLLKWNVAHIEQIDVQLEFDPLPLNRGDLDSVVQREHNITIDRGTGLVPIVMCIGSWLVIESNDDDDPSKFPVTHFLSNDDFREQYFGIVTKTETTIPNLKDLI